MSPLEQALYKTHKNPLEAAAELGIQYQNDIEIGLDQCVDCGIWLKPNQLIPDLDNQKICLDCRDFIGL